MPTYERLHLAQWESASPETPSWKFSVVSNTLAPLLEWYRTTNFNPADEQLLLTALSQAAYRGYGQLTGIVNDKEYRIWSDQNENCVTTVRQVREFYWRLYGFPCPLADHRVFFLLEATGLPDVLDATKRARADGVRADNAWHLAAAQKMWAESTSSDMLPHVYADDGWHGPPCCEDSGKKLHLSDPNQCECDCHDCPCPECEAVHGGKTLEIKPVPTAQVAWSDHYRSCDTCRKPGRVSVLFCPEGAELRNAVHGEKKS